MLSSRKREIRLAYADQSKGLQRRDLSGISGRPQSAPEMLEAEIVTPERPVGIIILAVTVPLSASSAGLRRLAAGLEDRGFATFLAELLSSCENRTRTSQFRLQDAGGPNCGGHRAPAPESAVRRTAARLLRNEHGRGGVAIAAAQPGAQPDGPAGALVMCDAGPELAIVELPRVHAPTLFIVQNVEGCDVDPADQEA